ncbi:MAG: hypothetical protein COX40_00545 [Candidatus Omnitrophica bacterium CG23_combo_of_CG06-09_8_20_14_all_40_11]|nr:MAG: hypothetical protein COX40_00545 [Candidatus Omnitrophica bacterium CG23_combo_of_CG06-09_8_20_14_all_40_11]
MKIFLWVAAILFFLLAFFAAFVPDIILKIDKLMATPLFATKDAIKTRKGVRLAVVLLFLFASFLMFIVVFTKSYKVVEKLF